MPLPSLNSFLPKSDNLSMVRAQWMEKFNLSDTDIEEWKSHVAPGEDLLRWGLMHSRIPEGHYLKWAMENFELPLVTNDFFTIPADQMFWDRVKDLHAWRPDFVPLAEWEGVLMIGCLQPPEDFHFRQPHRFVLVSAGNLQMYWSKFHPEAGDATPPVPHMDTEPAAVESPEGLAGLDLSTSDSPADNGTPEGLSFNFDSLNEDDAPHAEDSTPTEEESPLDSPIGLAETMTASINLDFSSLVGESPPAPSPEPASIPAVQVQPKTSTQAASTGKAPSEAKTSPVLKPAADVPTPPPPQPFGPSTQTTSPASNQSKPTVPNNKPSPGVLRELEAVRAATAASPHLNHAPPSQDNLMDFSAQVRGSNNASTGSVAETPLEACLNYNDLGAQVLLRVQKIYQQGMILLFQGGQLKPWKWTDNLAAVNSGNPTPIALEDASIFRIVFRTCLPFHGHVVPNPINDLFFTEFRGGVTPAHVTLMPIMIDQQIGGMVMGLTDAEVDYKNSLRKMETLTHEVAIHLKRLRGAKAA